jgi:hypothetical protein
MREAIFGLYSILFVLFFATATGAAGENAIAKDQRNLETLPSVWFDAGKSEKKFFLGYVEFDWDPDAPGGVPGFGPLPNGPAQVATAESPPVNATRRSNRPEE